MVNNPQPKTPRAPMRNDGYKRFAAYRKEEKRSWLDFLFDWIVKGIIIALLISINFVLFASSSNYSFFAEGMCVIPNIVLPVVVIFTLSLGTMFFISFSKLLENLMVSTVVGLFVFATINQFLMISPDSFLYTIFYDLISPDFARNFLKDSDFFVAVTLGVITFILISILSNRMVLLVGFIVLVIFGAIIADEYINQRHKSEFVTLFDNKNDNIDGEKGSNFIYIMLPNATSYRYLSDVEDEKIAAIDINKTKELMLGFYANNNFTLYANTYVEDNDPFMNIVNQFNILNNKKGKDAILSQIVIDGYMKFKNHNEKSVYLEDNRLFDKFKNANYKINVYQSHGIELCERNNEKVADKCVEKQNNPFNFDNMNISEFQKTQFLLLQWVNSTTLFKDLSKAYSFIGVFADANKIGLVGVPYNNLHVINSIKTLDILFDDILQGNGNTTYFALLDIPTEMYVYDDFCNVKPSDEWLAKDNLPWIKTPNIAERKKAYMQQTNCLYGKLQEFMDKLKIHGLDENSVVVVQGISGLNDKKSDSNFINDFRSKRSVAMGIREPKNKGFAVDNGICPVSSFLIKYLYSKNLCKYMDAFDWTQISKSEFYNDVNSKKIGRDEVYKSKREFSIWYEGWAANAGIDLQSPEMLKIRTKPLPVITETKVEETVVPKVNTKEKSVATETSTKELASQSAETQSTTTVTTTTTKKVVETAEKQITNLDKEEDIEENAENFYVEEDVTVEESTTTKSQNKIDEKPIVVDENEVLSIELDGII